MVCVHGRGGVLWPAVWIEVMQILLLVLCSLVDGGLLGQAVVVSNDVVSSPGPHRGVSVVIAVRVHGYMWL